MATVERQSRELRMDDVKIIFRNFAGEEGQYNRKGDRNFSIRLDNETAERLLADGWNVKTKPPREDGDEPFHHLPVSIGFGKGKIPPRLVMITSKGRTPLTEDLVEMLDWAEFEWVDLIINPYHWTVNGNSGVKAYLKTLYAKIREDELDLKYAHIPEVGAPSIEPPRDMLELEESDIRVIQGKVLDDEPIRGELEA